MDNLDKDIKDLEQEEMNDEVSNEMQEPDEDISTQEPDDGISAQEPESDDEAADADESEDSDDLKEKSPDEKKKGFFNKKEKKKDKKDLKIEELNDRLIRNMAEFDNFRKRTDKEKSQMFDAGAGLVVEKILPVIDDFERGMASVEPENAESSFVIGMDMVYKKLISTLSDMGVNVIESVGKEFDPMYHNAVMQEASEEYDSGIITQELQKGYIYKEKVIRHSMVVVAE